MMLVLTIFSTFPLIIYRHQNISLAVLFICFKNFNINFMELIEVSNSCFFGFGELVFWSKKLLKVKNIFAQFWCIQLYNRENSESFPNCVCVSLRDGLVHLI